MKTAKPILPPRPVQLRLRDLSETELRAEGVVYGYEDLSSYLRALIKLGREELRKRRGGGKR